jgi:hypothetical protein
MRGFKDALLVHFGKCPLFPAAEKGHLVAKQNGEKISKKY